MATRAADATFTTSSFVWTAGVFELTGEWHGGDDLGRVRLVADIGGRRKSLGARGGRVAEDGPDWGARFICMTPPDEGGYAAVQAGGREFELPAPVVRQAPPPPPPPPTAEPVDVAPAPPAGRFARPSAPPEPDDVRPPPPEGGTPYDVEPQAPPEPADSNGGPPEAEALLHAIRSEREALERARESLARERRAAEQVEARLAQVRRTAGERKPLPPRRPIARDEPTHEEIDYTALYWIFGALIFVFFLVLVWLL